MVYGTPRVMPTGQGVIKALSYHVTYAQYAAGVDRISVRPREGKRWVVYELWGAHTNTSDKVISWLIMLFKEQLTHQTVAAAVAADIHLSYHVTAGMSQLQYPFPINNDVELQLKADSLTDGGIYVFALVEEFDEFKPATP